jgi:hypothetical protein
VCQQIVGTLVPVSQGVWQGDGQNRRIWPAILASALSTRGVGNWTFILPPAFAGDSKSPATVEKVV